MEIMLTNMWIQIWIIVGTLLCICLASEIETYYPPADFCEGSAFSAECPPQQVVMIHNALYGRMSEGSCHTEGSVGCSGDVTGILDRHCSGRTACSVRVVDVFQSIPDGDRPCSDNLRSYLQVSYKCVKVRHGSEFCEIPLDSLHSPVGYLSSILPEPDSCGSIDRPWVFTGMQEQSLHFIMYDFSSGDLAGGGDMDKSCTVYLTIKERELHEYYTECKSGKKHNTIYTSKSSHVEVRINRRERDFFLLKFEVQGCISFRVPPGGWVKRSGEVAEMGCEGTSNTWSLHCKDNKWQGTIGNCSAYSEMPRSGASVGDGDSIFVGLFGSHWLAALAISAIAFTVALSILVAGIVYLKRRQIPLTTGKAVETGQPQYKYSTGPGAHTGGGGGPQGQMMYGPEGLHARPYDPHDNEYLKTIERQRLMLIGQHPQQHFAPKTDNNIRWQDGEHIYELPQFDTDTFKAKTDPPNKQGFQKQSFELSPRKPPTNQGPSVDNNDHSSRNVNNRSV